MNEKFEFKSAATGAIALDELQGIVECFVAGIGNKDSVGDIVVTGAFAKSLTRRKPRVVWAHSWNDPIGKVLEMYEVPAGDPRLPAKMRNAGIGGLYAKVQFNLQSEKGKEAFASVAFFGEEQEWSIGYKTINGAFDTAQQANVLREVELYEVSPVLHGANQLTGTISVKSESKNHMMPIIAGMPMMGGQSQQPRMIVVAAPQQEQGQDEPFNIFAEGLAQPLEMDKVQKIQTELSERTGSKVDIVEATDSFIVFRRTTTDGKVSMYRVGYHTPDGYNTFMFGKPEAYAGSEDKPTVQQQIEVKPADASMMPAQPQQMPYRDDDQDEMNTMLGGQVGIGKSAYAHLIEIPQGHMVQAKSMLQPVFNYHNLSTTDSDNGIIVNGSISAQAIDALQNAVKAIGQTIGQSVGNLRSLAENFNPFAIDGDNDGFAQDGTTFQRPYIPIKKPDMNLPDVAGRNRNSSEILDKPTIRTGKKPDKDPSLLSGQERQEALAAGDLQPRTMDDISFLANRRPENEGIAKYWDMSEEGLRAEGQKLVAARRGQTGSEREKTDAELFKISHEFSRRDAYKQQFGKDFVPPKRTESTGRETFNASKPDEVMQEVPMSAVLDAMKEWSKSRSTRGFGSRSGVTPEQQNRIDASRKRGSDIASGRAQILADNLKNLSDEDKDFIRENGIVAYLLEDGTGGPLSGEWAGDSPAERIGDLLPEGDWSTDSELQADAEDIFASYEEGFYGQLDKEFADLANPADLETEKSRWDSLSADEQDSILEQGRDSARGLASRGETTSEGQRPPRTAVAMQMDPKNSKLARQIDYDPQNGDLTVYYRDGKKETFNDVPYDRVRKAGTDDKPDALISALQREQKKPQSGSGFASRNVNREGNGLWGTNRPLDPDDDEISDEFIEDYLNDYVGMGELEFDELKEFNDKPEFLNRGREPLSDAELEDLFDRYQSDDLAVMAAAADEITTRFYRELLDDQYDYMVEQKNSRYDDYEDYDDYMSSRGFASLSRIKPGRVRGVVDDGAVEEIDLSDEIVNDLIYDDVSKELFVSTGGGWKKGEPDASGAIPYTRTEIRTYVLQDVSKEELNELGASRNLSESVNALEKIKTSRDFTNDDKFNFFGREDKFEGVETRLQLEKLLLNEQRKAKKAEKVARQARLDLSDDEFIADLLPRPTRSGPETEDFKRIESDYRSLMEMSLPELEKELEKAREKYGEARFVLLQRDGGVMGRDYEAEGVSSLETRANAVERIFVRKAQTGDGKADGFASRGLPPSLQKPTPLEELEEFKNFLDREYGDYFMDYTQMDDEELKKTLMKRYAMTRSEANATTRQIRKHENKLDDLTDAMVDAENATDGFASLGKWRPDDVNELLDSDENLRSEIEQAYFRNNPETPRPGSRDYDPQDAYDDFEANPEKYGYAKDFRKQAIEALKANGADRDEAERVADYWIENDGIHEEYLEEADGDSLYAMALAYDNYIEAAADDYNERQRGFGSRGDEMLEMRPYSDLTSKEKSDLYESIENYLNGRGDWARIKNELEEGGFDYDDFLQQNPEFHPDFADFGDAGDMGFGSRSSDAAMGLGEPVRISKFDIPAIFRYEELDRQTQKDFVDELDADGYFDGDTYSDDEKLRLAAEEWDGRGLTTREKYTDEMLSELYEMEALAEGFTTTERRGTAYDGSAFAYVEEIIKNPMSADYSDYEEARKTMDSMRASLSKDVLKREKYLDDANTLGEEDFGLASRGSAGNRTVKDFDRINSGFDARSIEDSEPYERVERLSAAKAELTAAIDEAENMLDGLDEDSPEWEELYSAQSEMESNLIDVENMMEEMVSEKGRLEDAMSEAATMVSDAEELRQARQNIDTPSAEDLQEMSFEDANFEYLSLSDDITEFVNENDLAVDWNPEKQAEIEKALRDGDYDKANDMLYDITQELYDAADDKYRDAEVEHDEYPFVSDVEGFSSRGGSRFDTFETPNSSAIEAVHYDRNTGELHVAFKPGQTGGEARYYTYSGVPADYFDNEVSGSNSIGRVINDVKKNYDVEVTNPRTVDAINGRGDVSSTPSRGKPSLGDWKPSPSGDKSTTVGASGIKYEVGKEYGLGDTYYAIGYREITTPDGRRTYETVMDYEGLESLDVAKSFSRIQENEELRKSGQGSVSSGSSIQDIDVRRSAALYESYYDPNAEELVVTFKDKDGNAAGSYIYEGVTADEANELASASSKGKIINRLKASKSVRRAGANDRMERTPGAEDDLGAGGYEAQVDAHWDKIGPEEQRSYFARAVDSAINAGSGTSAEDITADAKQRAYDDRQIAMMEMQAESLGMGYRNVDVGSSAALNRVQYDPSKRELRVEYRGRDGKGTGEFYVYKNVPQSVVDDIEASDSRGATLRRVRDDFEFTTESAIPESAFYSMGDAGDMGERSNPKITNRTNANGFYLDENGQATNYNKRAYTTSDIQKMNARRNGRDGFASMGQELQDLQSKIQIDLKNPGSRNGKRNKPIDPAVAANLANPESDAGTLVYPSTNEGDYIRISYNPEKRTYGVERIQTVRGFNRDEPPEEVVVDTADADTSYEAGSLVREFAENYVNELRLENDDDRRAATYESTFGRGGDADDGFASRASINESSTGQRIVPSRMHSDDREALAEITDPEERKQRIDELIEFYGPRIFAKPSAPKRKPSDYDEDGFLIENDGFASRQTSAFNPDSPMALLDEELDNNVSISNLINRPVQSLGTPFRQSAEYEPSINTTKWSDLTPRQKNLVSDDLIENNRAYFSAMERSGATLEEMDAEVGKLWDDEVRANITGLERALKKASDDYSFWARARAEEMNPTMSEKEIDDMLVDLGLSERDFDNLHGKNFGAEELASVAADLENKRREIIENIIKGSNQRTGGLASGGVNFDRYGNIPSRPKKPRRTSDPSLRNTPKNRARMTAERRLAEMANSGDPEYDNLMQRAKDALSKEGIAGYRLTNEYGEPNSLVAGKMQEILAQDILDGATPKTGGDRPKVDPLSILGGYSDGDVFGLTPRGFASRGESGSKKKTKEEVYAEMTKQLIDALSESEKLGKWQLPWRRTGMPENGTTGHKYSGSNWFFLTAMADVKGYNSNKWATYDQWQGVGGQVRKGEKATSIFVPIFIKGKEKADGTEDKGTIRFISRSVFNLDQIDGMPEDFDKKEILPESERVADLEKTISEIPAVIKNGGDEAYFSPSEDFIQLPLFENFKDARAYYSTAAHELMHWTGGKDRLGRENMNRFGTPEYAYEELVAEIASAMFMSAHNIEPNIQENHGPYLASWIKKLKDDPTALERAMKDAQSAVNYILNISPNAKSKFSNGEKAEFENPDIAVPTEPVVAVEGFASRGDWPTPGGYEPSEFDMRTALSQIGRGNLMAISGTRANKRNNEMVLPVNRNQQVIVGYDGGSDTYFVRAEQIITNGKDKGKTRVLGQWDNVYADELGETAYQASLKPSMLSDDNKVVWAQAFDHPQTGSLLDENGQVYEGGFASGADSMDPDELDAMDWAYDAAQDYLMEQEYMMPEGPSQDDGFASRMNLSTPEKNEIISIARRMNTSFTRSVVEQYDRNGELSDRQWDALNRMTLRGNRRGLASRGDAQSSVSKLEKIATPRMPVEYSENRTSSDAFEDTEMEIGAYLEYISSAMKEIIGNDEFNKKYKPRIDKIVNDMQDERSRYAPPPKWALDRATKLHDEMISESRMNGGGGLASRGNKKPRAPKVSWSPEDRQRYADGDKLRSKKRPGKRRDGPSASEFGFSSQGGPIDMIPSDIFIGDDGAGRSWGFEPIIRRAARRFGGTENMSDDQLASELGVPVEVAKKMRKQGARTRDIYLLDNLRIQVGGGSDLWGANNDPLFYYDQSGNPILDEADIPDVEDLAPDAPGARAPRTASRREYLDARPVLEEIGISETASQYSIMKNNNDVFSDKTWRRILAQGITRDEVNTLLKARKSKMTADSIYGDKQPVTRTVGRTDSLPLADVFGNQAFDSARGRRGFPQQVVDAISEITGRKPSISTVKKLINDPRSSSATARRAPFSLSPIELNQLLEKLGISTEEFDKFRSE